MPSGMCLCGEVAWQLAGPFSWMAHCHCTTCRKAHGTAYTTFVTFERDTFRWLRGQELIRGHASSLGNVRAFCARCGAKLPSLDPFPYAFAAPLEGELGIRPVDHIFVGVKAPWYTLPDDGLPRHAGHAMPADAFPTPRHTEPAADKIRGSCLCGRIAYELDGPLEGGAIVSCHCQRCRRARAAAHGSNLFIDADIFHWLRGEDGLVMFKVPEAARFAQTFCGDCGSPMPARAAGGGRRAIPCGSLDDDPGVRDGLHIFAGSRAAWETIADQLPRYEEYPPAGFPPLARRAAP